MTHDCRNPKTIQVHHYFAITEAAKSVFNLICVNEKAYELLNQKFDFYIF